MSAGDGSAMPSPRSAAGVCRPNGVSSLWQKSINRSRPEVDGVA